jgi:sulfate transport system substrate-binding protein
MTIRKLPLINLAAIFIAVLAVLLIVGKNFDRKAPVELLNVSYDPTRELYRDINAAFATQYEKESGTHLEIHQSHGGSSRQARLVVSGELNPDVVTLGLPSDVEILRKHGRIAEGWAARLPNHSRPYYSTIVFVVRKGNPSQIRDWPDLIKPGIEVITPDPKSSGNGKLTALAAWGAIVTRGGSESEARNFLKALYEHAPFLVPAARAAGIAFAVEKIGDVHLAWENEALREVTESNGGLEIVYPPVSILAEPSVAWVDANVEKNGRATIARTYLEYLFSDAAQEIIARNGYRPSNPKILEKYAERLPTLKLFDVTAVAKSWDDAQAKFFGENGIIDTVYRPKPR